MNAARQAAWLFFLMLVLACSGWYFAAAPEIIRLNDDTLANTADTVIMGLTVHRYNESGQLISRLESPQMRHIPAEDTNLFLSPHVIVAQENQSIWHIRSENAKSIHRGDQITFMKQVVIHQDKGEQNSESTFKTEKLLYFPKRKFATTDLAITFEQPGSIIHSRGMNAYLEDQHVELLNRARAVYVPNHA